MIKKTFYIDVADLPSKIIDTSMLFNYIHNTPPFSDDAKLDFLLYFLKHQKDKILKKYCL